MKSKVLIKMNSGDIFIGEKDEYIEDEKYISLKKPYTVAPVQGGFTIVPCDLQIMQSEDIEYINLNTNGIQYYSELKNYPIYFDAYNKATTKIIGLEDQKIIL
jgi:hypothetical protein